MKDTIIISGFPGVGKSHFYKECTNSHLVVYDSDSSNFSWLEPGVRNPDFPNNYIEHIKSLIGEADYILISSHEAVRCKMAEEGIHYMLVYPDHYAYADYMNRYRERQSSEEFIKLMSKNFHSFVEQCENDHFAGRCLLCEGVYLSDIIHACGKKLIKDMLDGSSYMVINNDRSEEVDDV